MDNIVFHIWGNQTEECTATFKGVGPFDAGTPEIEGDHKCWEQVREQVPHALGIRGGVDSCNPDNCAPADLQRCLWECHFFYVVDGMPEDAEDPRPSDCIPDGPDGADAGISEAGNDDNWFEEDKYGIFEEGDYKDGEGEDGTIYDIVHDYLEPTRKKGG